MKPPPLRLLAALLLATPCATHAVPRTFCNPLNLDYGWSAKGFRHSADPVIVLFKERYYLFTTDDLPGYRVSDDLLAWTRIEFPPDLLPLMSDNDRGTYCAPAAATDGVHLYFIRMERRKDRATVPVMRSAYPASGRWEQCGELRKTGDPALFFDAGRAWLYHGLGGATSVLEIDPATWTELPASERELRPAITNVADFHGGYERGRRELLGEEDTGAWLGRFKILPSPEAAWMTKHQERYYLQYATPGTVTEWYCDTVMEGGAPTGPFRHVDYAPVSMKVGGFMGSAGHSCVFQDRHGNSWRVTTMWIGVHDLFERRIGLFPTGFDAEGRMFTESALGDYPQVMPQGPRGKEPSLPTNWRVQSFGKACSASSSLDNRPPALAADEDCRTWWSARTGQAGEWFQMDLGGPTRVNALQVNFAEQDIVIKPAGPSAGPIRYKLLASDDGSRWRALADEIRTAPGPHDYIALSEPQPLRFLKIENLSVPGGGTFALRDLRVFGPGEGEAPRAVSNLTVVRHADDDRNATLTWTPSPGVDGYLIRFGTAPDRLFQTIQLQGGARASLTTHALTRGVGYVWRVDAFNAGGLTEGAPSQSK